MQVCPKFAIYSYLMFAYRPYSSIKHTILYSSGYNHYYNSAKKPENSLFYRLTLGYNHYYNDYNYYNNNADKKPEN